MLLKCYYLIYKLFASIYSSTSFVTRYFTGLPIFTLICPSLFFAEHCDPLACAIGVMESGRSMQTLDSARSRAAQVIATAIAPFLAAAGTTGPKDESWYWAAPLLLDLARDSKATRAWLQQGALPSTWAGEQADDDDGGEPGGHTEDACRGRVHMEPGLQAQAAESQPRQAADFDAKDVIGGHGQADDHARQRAGPRRPAPEDAEYQCREEGRSGDRESPGNHGQDGARLLRRHRGRQHGNDE